MRSVRQSEMQFDRVADSLRRVTKRRGKLGSPQVAMRSADHTFTFGDQDTPFHAASIGKLFTGVIVFQLVEGGHLRLDTRVDALLPSDIVTGLFQPDAPAPTVLDLLQHYSGAADYFEGRRGTSVLSEVLATPDRLWTPLELLDFARERLRPVGRPGERFLYSDTGFVLLGLIIEAVGGCSYHDAVRTHIVEPLNLNRTFLPRLTSPVVGDTTIAPLWMSGHDLSNAPALSCGWAGGGVAATPADLLTFSEALHGGRLVNHKHLTVMTAPRGRVRGGIHYGAAMMQLRFDGFSPFLRGRSRQVGHLGSTGTSLFYDPASGAHVVMNFHARQEIPRLIRTTIAMQSAVTS